MNQPGKVKKDNPASGDNRVRLFFDVLFYIWIAVIAFSLISFSHTKNIPYSEFIADLNKGVVNNLIVSDSQISGELQQANGKKEPFTTTRVDAQLADRLAKPGLVYSGSHGDALWGNIFWIVIGVLVVVPLLSMLFRGGGAAQGVFSQFSVEKNKARVYSETNIGVTFADVAGVDEAKEELQEVVAFLRDPTKYTRLGGRLPKGILLVGPPGTGKTLLARAVAGEAKVPFFSISGSEFVELFVGVGAARVRDLFAQATQAAPCIIFIDELDALGRSRSANPMVSHDEKEQTLNQLLVEMDGFDTKAGVVLLAATNRPEILDQALLRAGRFDRHVLVDRPDKKGRAEILQVHLKKVIADRNIDVNAIAASTPGFTGADLANVINEAALLAARRKAETVSQDDIEAAIERTVAGLEKKSRILGEHERRLVAHHEMGHALVGLCLPGSDKVQKVSIIPHGMGALGFTVQRPTEDRFILSKTELENKLATLLGGRAAELLIFGQPSTGAADDLMKATDLAKAIVERYGMEEQLGLATYCQPGTITESPAYPQLGTYISPDTARQIDLAVKGLLDAALDRATSVLKQNKDWLLSAADKLVHEETMTAGDILALKPVPCQQAAGANTLMVSSGV